MAFTERLAFLISAKADDAIREFQKVSKSGEKEFGRIEKLAGSANKVSAAMALPVAAGFALAANAASDLEQSMGAVESVFGDAGGAIEEFGETAAQTAGLSKREVNEMASTLGASLQGMGFEAEEAATTVVDLEKRAADMAATFGGSTAEAVQAVGSLLRGERDPIERYGVSLKEADVQARILAKGLDTSTVAAQKKATAVASLELLMEQTAATEGQFAREAEGAAGSLARAKAEMENATAELGTHLLPIVAKVASGVASLAEAFGTLPAEVQTGIIAISGMAVASGPVLTLVGNIKKLRDAIIAMNIAAKVSNLPALAASMGKFSLGIAGGVATIYAIKEAMDDTDDAAEDLADAFKATQGEITDSTKEAIAAFLEEKDALDFLADHDITIEQLAGAARNGAKAQQELADRVGLTGGELITFGKITSSVRDAMNEGGEKGKDLAEVLETEVEPAAEGTATAFERVTGQARDTRVEIEELTEEMEGLLTATNEVFDASLGYEGALNRTEDALKDYADAGKEAADAGGDQAAVTEAVERAGLDAAEAILAQSRAAVEYVEDLKALEGKTLDAGEAARIQREDLQKVADKLAPGDPLRQRLQGYITELDKTEGERIAKLEAQVEDAKTKLREVDNLFKSLETRYSTLTIKPFVRPVRQAPLPEDEAGSTKSAGVVVNINGTDADPAAIAEAVTRSIAWGLGSLGGLG